MKTTFSFFAAKNLCLAEYLPEKGWSHDHNMVSLNWFWVFVCAHLLEKEEGEKNQAETDGPGGGGEFFFLVVFIK